MFGVRHLNWKRGNRTPVPLPLNFFEQLDLRSHKSAAPGRTDDHFALMSRIAATL